jgi:hypothetical protein
MFRINILTTSLILLTTALTGQVAKDQVLRANVTIHNSNVILSWPAENYTGTFTLYRKLNYDEDDWGTQPIAVLDGTASSYTDNTSVSGKRYEYLIVKSRGGTTDALGYICAGNNAYEINAFAGIILLIDSTYITPLNNEIQRLILDLQKEGWKVTISYAGRSESPLDVKKRILGIQQSDKSIQVLLMLGNIPVPYSGFYSVNGDAPPPDGHVEGSGNHTGAWPADVYYGILENVFTDNTVNCTTGALQRNHNIVGDGKFDQTKLPSPAILEVGRIDLTNLPAFNKDDIELTRDYLNRNHAWRNGKWKVIERGLIDNNFTNFNLASTGYANFIAILGIDSVFDNRDYMNSQKVGSYLLSYGCGAGSYTSCSGIGNTSSFANDSFENVFTILSGSYFGDWDNVNNFLRAPLASSSLGSFWGGIPKWYIHHMGVGERIGKGVKISQNNTGFYFTGNFNMSHNSMHIAYMGDPTLKIRNLPAVESLTAVSSNNLVYLNWDRIGDQSYAIYRFDTLNRVFNRIHNLPINDTFFIDSFNHASGRYVYAVKCIKLETTGSGTFYNTGGAAYSTVEHINSVSAINDNQNLVYIYPNPVSEQIHIKIDTRIISTSTLSAKIYDLYGKGIMEFQIQPSSNRDVIMDVRELNDGIYICEIKGNGILNRQKILVSK